MQIKVDKLSLGYDGKPVAKDISFSVNVGDYLCIVGENGAGKSTLLKVLLGLHKPIAGKIDCKVSNKEIGYLPQQDDIQKDFPASVKEIVLSGCLNKSILRPFYTKAEREYVRQCLEKVNALDLINKCYRELSGGQQQRVLLARALASAQKMIILDEPVASLDPQATKEMYKVIKQINDNGVTVVMVSHDVETVLKFATHILHVGKAKCLFDTAVKYKEALNV